MRHCPNRFFHRILALALCLALAFAVTGHARAEAAPLPAVQVFTDYLDSIDIVYSTSDYNAETGMQTVFVSFAADHDFYKTLECQVLFGPQENMVSLRCWSLATPKVSRNKVLSTLNDLNSSFKFTKFVLDDSDGTVQAEMDMFMDPATCAVPVFNAVVIMISIIDSDSCVSQLQALTKSISIQ